jgi:uncharacterized protein (TIGR02444 family)
MMGPGNHARTGEEAMTVAFPDHPFWNFSLAVYGSDGVPQACLDLQDAHQLDVNILLCCLWLGASGRGALSGDEMSTVTEAVHDWHHDIVRGLRAVRQRLKGGMPPAPEDLSEPLRARAQKLEIDLEHVEQLMLAASVERAPDDAADGGARIRAALANVGRYFDAIGARQTAVDRRSLAVILRAAFADADPELVDKICVGLTAA